MSNKKNNLSRVDKILQKVSNSIAESLTHNIFENEEELRSCWVVSIADRQGKLVLRTRAGCQGRRAR
jgi:hypothetical protein